MYICLYCCCNNFVSDPPGKPDAPEIEDWDIDHIDISWKAPKSDGGAPITGYMIEKRDKFNIRWSSALEVPADQRRATVSHLTENKDYQFRVTAINKAGPGVPSEASPTTTAKSRYGIYLLSFCRSRTIYMCQSDVQSYIKIISVS